MSEDATGLRRGTSAAARVVAARALLAAGLPSEPRPAQQGATSTPRRAINALRKLVDVTRGRLRLPLQEVERLGQTVTGGMGGDSVTAQLLHLQMAGQAGKMVDFLSDVGLGKRRATEARVRAAAIVLHAGLDLFEKESA